MLFLNSGRGSSTHDGSQRSRIQLLFNSWWVCWCQTQNCNLSYNCSYSEVISFFFFATWLYFSEFLSSLIVNVILSKPFGKKNVSPIFRCCLNCILFSGPAFDPLGQARGPAPPLEEKNEDAWVIFLFWYLQYVNVMCKNILPTIFGKTSTQASNLQIILISRRVKE